MTSETGSGLSPEGEKEGNVSNADPVVSFSATLLLLAGSMKTGIQGVLLIGSLALSAISNATAEIEVLPSMAGAFGHMPLDLNDRGRIVGIAFGDAFLPQPVTWRDGQIIQLPGSPWGEARSVNDKDEIVGTTYSDTMLPSPVVWRNERPNWLPTIGFGGAAVGINNQGEIVGNVFTLGGRSLPALWKDGKLILLAHNGTEDARAVGIDDTGLISGIVTNSFTGRTRPVQWTSSGIFGVSGVTPSALIKVGQAQTSIRTVNGESVITGTILNPSNWDQPAAAVWRNRWMKKLPDLSNIGRSEAYDTNRNGVTFGYSVDSEGLITAVYWNQDGANRLPKLGTWTSIAYAGNNGGEIVGICNDENGWAQPVRWRLNEVTRINMKSFQTPRSRSITLTATAMKGNAPVRGAETEFQLNGQTVGFAKTNQQGVASLVVPVTGSKEGNHQIMASLGGSKYIFRSWVNGRSAPDLQVQEASGRRNENAQIRFKLSSDELDAPLANRRVRIWLGAREIGSALTSANGEGTATIRLTNFPVGAHRIELRYSGDGVSFGGSNFTSLTVTP